MRGRSLAIPFSTKLLMTLVGSWLVSCPLKAGPQLIAGIGGASGLMVKGHSSYVLLGYEYGFYPGISLRTQSAYSLDLGLAMNQISANFTEQGVTKKLSWGRLGSMVGFGVPLSETFFLQIQGEYSNQSVISVLSISSIDLNSERFTYSTLQTYKAGPFSGIHINIVHDKIDEGFSKSGRYRTGIGFSLGAQRLLSEESKVRTSSTESSPEETLEERAVDYSLKTATFKFFIGLSL